AVVAAHEWSPGARLVVAAAALLCLLGLAVAGDGDEHGDEYGVDGADGVDGGRGDARACALVMIAVGLLCHPVAGPLAGLASAAAPGEGPAAVLPFVLAAAAAAAGACGSGRMAERRDVLGGHCRRFAAR